MFLVISFLIIVSLGFLYRCRGGLFQQLTGIDLGDTKSRILFWGLPVAIAFLLLGFNYWQALVAGVLAFVTTTIGNFDAMDLGKNEGSFVKDMLLLTLKGFITGALPALAFWHSGHNPAILIIACSAMSLAYWAAYLKPLKIKGLGYGDGAATGYDFPETGEFYFGLLFGIGLVLSAVFPQ